MSDSPDKSLKSKAIKVQGGKQYVLVADRVIFFNETYPQGCIQTEIAKWEGDMIVIKATAYPDGLGGRFFTGFAQEISGTGTVNKTSALENAETSAVGRCLAFMGIGVIDSIASVDEINKAKNRTPVQDDMPSLDYPAVEYKASCKKCGLEGLATELSKATAYGAKFRLNCECGQVNWLAQKDVQQTLSKEDGNS